ncbi:MAG: hypothetical protein JOZ72_17225 [Alphaproteobacteria bacterium]|nr:hypothetical protein [Alphaproteobacteria bacterium]
MAFREKISWISLVLTLAVYGGYFAVGGFASFLGLVGATVLFVVLMVAFTIVVSVISPKDASAPKDERERLIAYKSVYIAHFVVAGGAFMAIGALFFDIDRLIVANGLFFAMILGEVVSDTAQIVYFRRGV